MFRKDMFWSTCLYGISIWLLGVSAQATETACELLIVETQSEAVQDAPLEAIDLTPFRSCISHWRDLRDETRFIKVEKDQPSYRPEQVREIVENILLFQRENGGWPKTTI